MPWFDTFDAIVPQRFPGMEIGKEEPMDRHTTFRVGGPARRFVRPGSEEACGALLELAEVQAWPVLVVGNGSNLLVSDEGLDRLVIHTGGLDSLERTGERTIRAGAGVSLARLASFAQKEGLAGLEFAHGIPGSLGGAVFYGGEMKQVLSSVAAWFPGGGVKEIPACGLELGYRRSIFSSREGAVLAAEIALEPREAGEIRDRMEELGRRRREKQPLEFPSAGSTFKRPEGHFAGGLIDQCGLKGFRIGGAQVSEKHAGFVINAGGATCADVLALIGHIQKTVRERTGVELETEVKILR